MSGLFFQLLLAAAICGLAQSAASFYDLETQLRQKLLNPPAPELPYDAQVPPIGDEVGVGVPIETGMEIYKINSLDVPSGQLNMKVWLRSSWTDPRLAWKGVTGFEDYATLPQLEMRGTPHSADAQIWVPDYELYNGVGSLYSQSVTAPMVYPSGYVFLSRPVDITVLCSFKDADMYPFHAVSCEAVFGGWSVSGFKANYVGNKGITATYGTYDNYVVDLANSKQSITQFTYPCCPDEKWPTDTYTIMLSNNQYAFSKTVLGMNVMLVVLSFTTLWLDVKSTEALNTSAILFLTLLMVNFAAQIMVPMNPDRMTWMYTFLAYSVTQSFLCCVANGMASYFDNANQKLVERLAEDPNADWSFFFTPGAHYGGKLEQMGWDSMAYIIKFFGGFLLPLIYGSELTDLAAALTGKSTSDSLTAAVTNVKNNTPETTGVPGLASAITACGVILIIFSLLSTLSEIYSRHAGLNPKVDRYVSQPKKVRRAGPAAKSKASVGGMSNDVDQL